MLFHSVVKDYILSAALLVTIAAPAIAGADEQSGETGHVVGSAVEVSDMLETSSVVTSSEVVISQEDEPHGVKSSPEAAP